MVAIEESYSLKSSNTFGIQCLTNLFAKGDTISDLLEIISSFQADPRPKLILGGGSNLVFTKDFAGVVIFPDLKGKEVMKKDQDHVWVRVLAGENWDNFVSYCVSQNWGGVENLSLIPGNVGACPIQNIGAYGVEVKDVIESVEVVNRLTGEFRVFSNAECRFGYRNSIFKNEAKNMYIITSVIFKLALKPVLNARYKDVEEELAFTGGRNIQAVRQAVINIRRRKLPDPSDYGNAGSFFKNPLITPEKFDTIRKDYPNVSSFPAGNLVKISAAWLIQQCGWKGKREGNVGTYPTQPLVIVNYGGATGREILDFATKIQDSVRQQFGIDLEMEVNIV